MPHPPYAAYDPGVSDFLVRPVTRDDAVAVNDLLAAAETVDRTEEHYSVADVEEELANPMIDLERDWIVAESGGRLIGHCRLMPRAPDDGAVSVTVDGTVHPDHRGQGLGSQLVPLMIDRAHGYARERGLRAVISGAAPSANTDAADIFDRQGLRPHRWSFVMEADLAVTVEPPSMPEGYTVSTWEGVSAEELREAHNSAFVGHPGFTPWSEEMWAQWVSESRNFRPALSLVARDEAGRVAAYIQTSEFDAVTEVMGIRDAFVAKVGTLEGHRRRGLAGALLGIALQRYRDEGFDRSSLDVDSENPTGALGVYERAGFRTTQRWTNFLLAD